MEVCKKVKSYLERLNKTLTTGFNFILVFIVYWLGVSLSFLFFKATKIRKRLVETKTYWIDYRRESEDYRRQY